MGTNANMRIYPAQKLQKPVDFDLNLRLIRMCTVGDGWSAKGMAMHISVPSLLPRAQSYLNIMKFVIQEVKIFVHLA